MDDRSLAAPEPCDLDVMERGASAEVSRACAEIRWLRELVRRLSEATNDGAGRAADAHGCCVERLRMKVSGERSVGETWTCPVCDNGWVWYANGESRGWRRVKERACRRCGDILEDVKPEDDLTAYCLDCWSVRDEPLEDGRKTYKDEPEESEACGPRGDVGCCRIGLNDAPMDRWFYCPECGRIWHWRDGVWAQVMGECCREWLHREPVDHEVGHQGHCSACGTLWVWDGEHWVAPNTNKVYP